MFLKHIPDAFEEQHAKLVVERARGADPKDRDGHRARSIFWAPPKARWLDEAIWKNLRELGYGSQTPAWRDGQPAHPGPAARGGPIPGRAGRGAKVIDRQAADLREALPDMGDFPPRDLKYVRAFAAACRSGHSCKKLLHEFPGSTTSCSWRSSTSPPNGSGTPGR